MTPPESAAELRLGSFRWTQSTGGMLRRGNQLRMLGEGLLYGLATAPPQLRSALGLRRRRLARVEPAMLEPPDSQAARQAEQLLSEVAPPVVINHSLRSFAFAAVLGAHDGLRYDREVVYVASLLHDLYFARPDALPNPHCFTLPAAERALALTSDAGYSEGRQQLVADAITLHLNVWPPRDTAEAYLVFAGPRLDVVGYRHWDIAPEAVDSVVGRYPRLQMKRHSVATMSAQSEANPGSRAHFYKRYLFSSIFVRRAPFAE